MSMSRRERTLLMATGAVLGLLALDQYVVTPLFNQRDQMDAKRDEIVADLAKSQKILADRRQLAPKWHSMVNSGLKDKPSEAEAQVLHALRDWAKDAGLTISSLKPDRPESKQQLKEVLVQADAIGSMDSVLKFMWKLQTAPFPIKATEMQLDARNGGSDLALQLKISTLYLGDEPKDTKEKPKPAGDAVAGGER